MCPGTEANVGAVATQAISSGGYGPRGLELLRQGLTAEPVLKRFVEGDSSPPSAETRLMPSAAAKRISPLYAFAVTAGNRAVLRQDAIARWPAGSRSPPRSSGR
ncbi:MAG: DUF1028 domain-containing protein [Vicinamibacterales bacterium]